MNVGFLVPELINCGPINLVLTLAENLKEIGHNVKLISIRESQNSDIFEKFGLDIVVLSHAEIDSNSKFEVMGSIEIEKL